MKVYLTKYALTSGITEHEAEKTGTNSGYWRIEGFYSLFGKNDCHENKDDAIAAAEEMRIKRLKSLDKQIKKLSVIDFSI